MSLNWLSLARLSITTRLLLWFLAISLIPCSVLTIVTNSLSVRSLERSVRNQLVSILSSKTIELDNFVRERRGDVEFLSQVPRTIQATDELSRGIERGLIKEADRLRKEQEYRPTAMSFSAGLRIRQSLPL